MNLFKSIQHMLLASLVATSVVPVAEAMNNNRRPATNSQRNVRLKTNKIANQPAVTKKTKRAFWKRITDNWEYLVVGGCVVVGIAALIWSLNKNNAGSTGTIVPHAECTVCLDSFYESGEQMKKPVSCIHCPNTKGQGHFFHAECLNGWKNSERSLGRHCPICREAGGLLANARPAQRETKK